MKKLLNRVQTDLLRRHIGPFIFCFLTIMFLLMMQFLILHIDKLIGKGLPLGVIIELILTNLAYMVVLAAPMAVLVSTLMAFGKFSEYNEFTAMRAAGVNPVRVINPVLAVAVLMSLFLVWFSNDVLPDANQKARSLFIDIRMKKPGFDLKPDQFYEGIDGYTFLVKDIDNETDSLYNVTLFQDRSSNRNKAIIKSKRGQLLSEQNRQTLTLYLYDGSILRYVYTSDKRREILEKTEFDQYRISFDLSEMAFSRSNPNERSRNDRTMSARAMLAVVDSLRDDIRQEIQKTYAKHYIYSDTVERAGKEQPGNLSSYSNTNGRRVDNAPIESNYLGLSLVNSRSRQVGLKELALKNLREYKSSVENLNVNVDWRKNRIAQYLVEVHKKYSIPIACIIFVLIGAPIGLFTKKGNLGFAALFGTGFLTFYWVSIIQGEKLADRLYISPATGMWFADLLLGIAGGLMLLKLSTSFKFSNLWPSSD